MKRLFICLLVILAACTSQDPEPNGGPIPLAPTISNDPIRSQSNAIDPGCHGGEWFQSHNLGTITPWNYNEWATFVLKAQVPQMGVGGMGPVQIKYKITNGGPAKVRLNFQPLSPPASSPGGYWSGNFLPTINAGSSVTLTLTISACQPSESDGWYEYQFGMMFQNFGGGPTSGIGGEILSVTGLNCLHCYEHKKANHDQGFSWTVQ